MEKISTVRAADTCLRILQHIAFAEGPLGVTQIAAQVDTAKGAVHKHLRTLIDHGMVVQNAQTSLYSVGPKVWLMGQRAPQAQELSEIALPLMRATRDELGLAVVLSVPTPRSAFVLATLSSNQPIDIGVKPGSELSLHASAQGLVMLAFGKPELRDALKPPLAKITPKTTTDINEILAAVKVVAERGYSVTPEQSLLGINALAAPIFDRSGTLVGSIGLIGSVQYLHPQPEARQIGAVLSLTRQISERL